MFNLVPQVNAAPASPNGDSTNLIKAGINVPSLSDIITFVIRGFFMIAALAAILYLLLGAFSWITSGGNKENVQKAQEKIQAAVLGLIIIFIVLSLVVLVESIFNIGLGIKNPIVVPTLKSPY